MTINARQLSRQTASVLRRVTDRGESVAIEHFGRVAAFLVPSGGRQVVRRGGKTVYEVPKPPPLRDLDAMQISVLEFLSTNGPSVLDEICYACGSFSEVAVALAGLEFVEPPLALMTRSGRRRITDEGERHVRALGG